MTLPCEKKCKKNDVGFQENAASPLCEQRRREKEHCCSAFPLGKKDIKPQKYCNIMKFKQR